MKSQYLKIHFEKKKKNKSREINLEIMKSRIRQQLQRLAWQS